MCPYGWGATKEDKYRKHLASTQVVVCDVLHGLTCNTSWMKESIKRWHPSLAIDSNNWRELLSTLINPGPSVHSLGLARKKCNTCNPPKPHAITPATAPSVYIHRVILKHFHSQKTRTVFHAALKGKAIPVQDWTSPEVFRCFKFPDFKTIGTWRWWGCQPTHWPPLPLKERFPVLICVTGWGDPRAIVRTEGLCQRKIPWHLQESNPRLSKPFAQCLNHLRHHVPRATSRVQ